MKTVSDDYIAKEESSERKPVELYHIWRDDSSLNWYLTSGDEPIIYNGQTYTPATLERKDLKFNSELEVTTLKIIAGYIEGFITEYITINPVEVMWVNVMKVFRDQVPVEASTIFIGQIKDVSFKGVAAEVNCVGFEYFLKMPIPTMRYQLTCNWRLYSDECKIVKSSYKTTTSGTLNTTKTVLTSTAFGTKDNDYYTGGIIEFGSNARTIINHTGDAITMVYKMQDLEDYDTVDVYPGCDRRAETCRDTYNNILNFTGFPFIPVDNPATRT